MNKNKLINIVEWCNYIAIILLAFSMNFKGPKHPLKLFPIGIFIFTWIIEFIYYKKWASYKFQKYHIFLFSVIIYFILGYLWYPIDIDTKALMFIQERKILLLIVPIILLFGLNNKVKIKPILYAIILGVIVSILYIICYKIGYTKFIESDNMPNLFNSVRAAYKHHAPFNLALNIAVCSIFYLFIETKKFYITILVIPLVFISYFLFHTEGRLGFISLIITVFIVFLYLFNLLLQQLKSKYLRRTIKISIIVIGLVSSTLLIIHHPRMKRYRATNIENLLTKKNFGRLIIWNNAWNCIKEKPIIGYGIGGAQIRLDIEHEKVGYHPHAKNLYHTHNQILQSWLQFGILGLISTLIILFFPFMGYKLKNFNLIFILGMVILVANMTEPMLHKEFGIIPFSIVMIICLCEQKKIKKS